MPGDKVDDRVKYLEKNAIDYLVGYGTIRIAKSFTDIFKKDENFYIGKIRYGGYKTYKKDDEPIYYASIEVGSLLGMSNSEVLTRDRPSRIPEELKLYCSYKNGKMVYDVEKSNIIDIRVVNDTLTYLLLICDHSIIERLSLDYLTDPIK